MKKLHIAVVGAGLMLSTNAHAALTTYIGVAPAKTDFLAATGATDATGTGQLPNLGASGTVLTLGDITFTTQPGHTIYVGTGGATLYTSTGHVPFTDWTTLLTGPDIAISDTENLDVTVNTGFSYSFGFDFVEPTTGTVNGPFVDSIFTVTLLNGAASVGSFTFNAQNDQAAFVGVWSDTLFNKVQIRETVGGIGNEFFGEFYKGVAPVPEPGTMIAGALLLLPFGATFIRRLTQNGRA